MDEIMSYNYNIYKTNVMKICYTNYNVYMSYKVKKQYVRPNFYYKTNKWLKECSKVFRIGGILLY